MYVLRIIILNNMFMGSIYIFLIFLGKVSCIWELLLTWYFVLFFLKIIVYIRNVKLKRIDFFLGKKIFFFYILFWLRIVYVDK